MTANVIVTVEREFDTSRRQVFRAWTDPQQLVKWRGSPGWHVEEDTVRGVTELGGRHYHVKIRDADPTTRVATDGVYTEYFEPDVFVSRERITGDPGIDPDKPLELRVEFNDMGRDRTLVRIIQGPYEPDVAGWHGDAWEKELTRLEAFLDGTGPEGTAGKGAAA
ncbi:MAG: SRPBCC domain-containing protein [Micropruina sp.]